MGYASQILIGPDQYLGFKPKPRRLPMTQAQAFFNASGPIDAKELIDNGNSDLRDRIRNNRNIDPGNGSPNDTQPADPDNGNEYETHDPDKGSGNDNEYVIHGPGNGSANDDDNGSGNGNGDESGNEDKNEQPTDASNYLQYAIPAAAIILAIIAYQYLN